MNHNPAISLQNPNGNTLQYFGVTQPTGAFWLAALVALALHAALLWGFNRHPFVERIVPPKDVVKIVEWPFTPDDPPEPKPKELNDDPPAVRVSALLDVPQPVSIETVFTQKAEPIAPLEKAGPEGARVSIPISYRRGPGDDGGTIDLFKPSELDRVPEPITRVSPDYPYGLKQAGISGSVRIGFIVDHHGNVVSPNVLSSTNQGFERAAVEALAKWKFRPGMKNGRKVNTRMEQPIDFSAQP